LTEERQTFRGLATWLVSLDSPDSVWRRTVTLEQIIHEARLALETEDAETVPPPHPAQDNPQ
jgi:hypothetical protein